MWIPALILLLPLICWAQPRSLAHPTASSGCAEGSGGAYRLTLTATPGYRPASLRRPGVAKPVAGIEGLGDHPTLLPNLPNPFNPTTTLRYALPVRTRVRLGIYNVLGQQIRQLVDQEQEPGFHTQLWDGLAQAGQPAASGVYFCRLQAGEHLRVARMLLAK